MFSRTVGLLSLLVPSLVCGGAMAQPYADPDRGEPGDIKIQRYLQREAEHIHGEFLQGVTSLAHWQELHDPRKQEYFHMLGLWPLPEKTPLEATVTGTLHG